MKKIINALTDFKSVGTLLAFNSAAIYYSSLDLIGIGMGSYALVSIALLSYNVFTSSKNVDLKEIMVLDKECSNLFYSVIANTDYYAKPRLKKVFYEKTQLMKILNKDASNPYKQMITKQAINLISLFFNLADNYVQRRRELSTININEIKYRIETNKKRMNFLKDNEAKNDLQKVIDMDQKLISSVNDEYKELEKLSIKLDYIESTIMQLKTRILSSADLESIPSDIENMVNEATALSTVLEERRKSGNRLRN